MMKNMYNKRLFAVMLAVVILLTALFSSCGKKKFDDPAEHLRYVEGEAISSGLEMISATHDTAQTVGGLKNSLSVASSVDIDISEEALGMLSLLAGGELDLSWLSNIGIDSSVYFDGGLFSMAMDLLLGESKITDIDIACDYNTSKLFISLPDILTKAVEMNYGDYATVDFSAALQEAGTLPSSETVSALIEKYTDMILDGVKTVEKSDEKLTVAEVEQACTLFKVIVSEEDAKSIATTVLTAFKADEELKSVIVAYGDYFIKAGLDIDVNGDHPESGAELYEMLGSSADELLAEIAEDPADEEADPIILMDYVNGDDKIIGRTLMYGEDEVIGYAVARNGKNFGFELNIEGETLVVGSGTSDKTVNGEFKITEAGIDYAVIKLTELADDLSKGTIDIEILELPDAEGAEMLASIFSAYSLRITLDKAQAEIAVMNGENKFVTVTVKTDIKEVEKVTLPTEDDTYELTEDLDTNELLALLDLEPLFANMNDSPIPGEYVNLLQIYLAMALQGQLG